MFGGLIGSFVEPLFERYLRRPKLELVVTQGVARSTDGIEPKVVVRNRREAKAWDVVLRTFCERELVFESDPIDVPGEDEARPRAFIPAKHCAETAAQGMMPSGPVHFELLHRSRVVARRDYDWM